MDLHIWLSGDDTDEALPSLRRWLVDDGLGPDLDVPLAPQPAHAGEMGPGTFDIVNAVVSNGLALAGLIMAVVAWRDSRPRPPSVHIRHRDVVVTVEADSPEEVGRIIELLSQQEQAQP